MNAEVNQQSILDQLDELKIKLKLIKNQLKDSKEKLSDPNLFIELNKNKNFFTCNIINNLKQELNDQKNNEKLIKKSNNLIETVENYINDVEDVKFKIQNNYNNNDELLKSIYPSLSTAIQTISPLCTNGVKPKKNNVIETGKTLLYGGSAILFGGLASLILCPILSPFLFIGGAVSCTTGAPLTVIGNAIESIKNKSKYF